MKVKIQMSDIGEFPEYDWDEEDNCSPPPQPPLPPHFGWKALRYLLRNCG